MQKKMNVNIRHETIADQSHIHRVNHLAFGRLDEADLVDRLRKTCPNFVSLVAVWDGRIVGHVFFTPAQIKFEDHAVLDGMALAPLAVMPAFQRCGVGKALCEKGLAILADRNTPFVIVLGHPQYYPPFGFKPAHLYHIHCCYPDVPPEAFMIKVFQSDQFNGMSGIAYFRSEFDEVT